MMNIYLEFIHLIHLFLLYQNFNLYFIGQFALIEFATCECFISAILIKLY